MLQKNDLILILTDMEDKEKQGDNFYKGAHEHLIKMFTTNDISLETLKFINERRPLDVTNFYERIRKNYNNKKSNLYKNIVKDIEDPTEAITTLSAFVLNLFLYSKHVEEENKTQFFKHVRAEEVTRVLNKFYKDHDVSSALKELRIIKADIIAFEEILGRR